MPMVCGTTSAVDAARNPKGVTATTKVKQIVGERPAGVKYRMIALVRWASDDHRQQSVQLPRQYRVGKVTERLVLRGGRRGRCPSAAADLKHQLVASVGVLLYFLPTFR